MPIPKGHVKSETKISEFKPDLHDYWVQNENNETLAEKWLVMLFPELSSFRNLLNNTGVSLDDILDYVYNLKTVKNHGYGNVQVSIFQGKITKIEALIRTIKHKEGEEKK